MNVASVGLRTFRITTVAAALGVSGCYHTYIETGLPGSGEVISQDWASGFLWGLIGPPTVSASPRCPLGIASVETKHSVPNLIVSALTGGIYTPMTIDVICANKLPAPRR